MLSRRNAPSQATRVERHVRLSIVLVLLALDDDGLPRARDRVAQAERECHYPARLVRLQRRLHRVGVRAEKEHDLARRRLDSERGVELRERWEREQFGVLARNRGGRERIGVGAGVALEGEHLILRIRVSTGRGVASIRDVPVRSHVLTNLECGRLRVCNHVVLVLVLAHLLVHDRCGDDLVCLGVHRAFAHARTEAEAVVDVVEVVRPVIADELQHLAEVQ